MTCIPTLEEMQCMGGHSLLVISCQLAVGWWTTIIIIIIPTLRPKCWLTVYDTAYVIRIIMHFFSIFEWKRINFWKTQNVQTIPFDWLLFWIYRYTYGQPVNGEVVVSFAVKLSQRARERQTTVVDEVILIDSMEDKMNFRIQILAFTLSVLWKLAILFHCMVVFSCVKFCLSKLH